MTKDALVEMAYATHDAQQKQQEMLNEAFAMALLGQIALKHLLPALSQQNKEALKEDIQATLKEQLQDNNPKKAHWRTRLQLHASDVLLLLESD